MKTTITIEVDLVTALCVIANIQLAGRHPENKGTPKLVGEKFARKLQARVAEVKPGMLTVMEAGWNPALDISDN